MHRYYGFNYKNTCDTFLREVGHSKLSLRFLERISFQYSSCNVPIYVTKSGKVLKGTLRLKAVYGVHTHMYVCGLCLPSSKCNLALVSCYQNKSLPLLQKSLTLLYLPSGCRISNCSFFDLLGFKESKQHAMNQISICS